MWKKRKAIEGVSAGPMIALKASLFERQFQEKQTKVVGEKKPKVAKSLRDALGVANPGVQEREAKDIKARQQEGELQSADHVEAKLREKAELYERMQRGEVDYKSDDEKAPLVDFVKKKYEHEQEHRRLEEAPKQAEDEDSLDSLGRSKKQRRLYNAGSESESSSDGGRRRARSSSSRSGSRYHDDRRSRSPSRSRRSPPRERPWDGPEELISEDQRREWKRQQWERQQDELRKKEIDAEIQKEEQIRMIERIRDETKANRQRHEQKKLRRQEVLEDRLARIKRRLEMEKQGGNAPSGSLKPPKAEDSSSSSGSSEEEEEVKEEYDPFNEEDEQALPPGPV